MLRKIKTWLKDPFGIERDWVDFKSMSERELHEEFNKQLNGKINRDRLRRLCMYLAIRWDINYMESQQLPTESGEDDN